MRCKKARIMLSAALDGELLRRQQAALERHISSCEACAGERASLSALRDTMALWADEAPSEWLAEAFARKLRQLQEQPIRVRRSRWVLGTASAGLATVMIALVFLLHSQIQPPAPINAPEHVAVVNQPVEQPASPKIVIKPVPVVEKSPASKPVHVAKPIVTIHVRPTRRVEPASRSTTPVVMASVARGDATSPVTDNLGEAGLAMNGSIERVRGTLRKAADLMAAQYTEPAGISNPNGGEIL